MQLEMNRKGSKTSYSFALTKILAWPIRDLIKSQSDYFEQAKTRLVYNFSLFFLALQSIYTIHITANSFYYQAKLSVIIIVSSMLIPIILKYKKSYIGAGTMFAIVHAILLMANIIGFNGEVNILAVAWATVNFLYAFFVLGIRIGAIIFFVDFMILAIYSIEYTREIFRFGIYFNPSEILPVDLPGLMIPFAFMLYISAQFLKVNTTAETALNNEKQKVDEGLAELKVTHGKLKESNDVMTEQSKEIMDSITYAKRIQESFLPSEEVLAASLPNSYLFYKPKDIVAGDFYWLEQTGDYVVFAVADCTGHGVPGAMVSMICSDALHRCVKEYNITSPNEILNKSRELVIQAFGRGTTEIKDGMDISVCTLNTKTLKLQFAGANNPLYHITNAGNDGSTIVNEVKGDKQPIGVFERPKPFENHTLQLNKGDGIVLFSDGFVDQFGGEKGKKYKSRNFKKLLTSIHKHSINTQKAILEKEFESWKGELEQVDDVCVMSLKV